MTITKLQVKDFFFEAWKSREDFLFKNVKEWKKRNERMNKDEALIKTIEERFLETFFKR